MRCFLTLEPAEEDVRQDYLNVRAGGPQLDVPGECVFVTVLDSHSPFVSLHPRSLSQRLFKADVRSESRCVHRVVSCCLTSATDAQTEIHICISVSFLHRQYFLSHSASVLGWLWLGERCSVLFFLIETKQLMGMIFSLFSFTPKQKSSSLCQKEAIHGQYSGSIKGFHSISKRSWHAGIPCHLVAIRLHCMYPCAKYISKPVYKVYTKN